MDDLNDLANSIGGQWRSLKSKDDGVLEGVVLDYAKRPMTWEGEPVLSRKTKQPREEWVFTLEVAGEDEPIKIGFNESAQRAISNAIKAYDGKAQTGDTLKIVVTKDKEDSFSQAEYEAKWLATPKAVAPGESLL